MKLVVAIVKSEDADRLVENLVKAKHRATKLASTGGFLGVGNTTFLVGVDAASVDDVLCIVRGCCASRERFLTQAYEFMPVGAQRPVEVSVGGATVFVLDITEFHRFSQVV